MKRLLLLLLAAAFLLPGGCNAKKPDGMRGWYYAGTHLKDNDALGGFGPCDNFPKKCVKDGPGRAGELSLVAFPDKVVSFHNRKAIILRVINRTDKTVAFSACDSSLYIVQEALDSDGQWKPLERFPDTFCGNSFHRVFLESDEYWEFFAIRRSGGFETKLRFRLERDGEKGIAAGRGSLVSNEYKGNVNRSHFVRIAPPE